MDIQKLMHARVYIYIIMFGKHIARYVPGYTY